MALTKEEKAALAELQRKAKEPEDMGRHSLNISVDLGDEKQLERAKKLGLLRGLFDTDDTDDEDEDEEEGDDTPKRRSYFKEP